MTGIGRCIWPLLEAKDVAESSLAGACIRENLLVALLPAIKNHADAESSRAKAVAELMTIQAG